MDNGTSEASWLAFGSVEIDVAGHRLLVNGVHVALERKAFAVLLLFARHPGRVFTRDEILDSIWGHSHVTPGVLTRIIALLRQALGESADENRYLHTVHGVGYRLDASVRERRAEEEHKLSPPEVLAPVGQGNPSAPGPEPLGMDEPGDRRSATVESASSAVDGRLDTAPRRAFSWRIGMLVGIFAAVFAFATYFFVVGVQQTSGATPTLIVLPLLAVGGGHDETVLADGLSEELVTRLARANGLRVISSTSARLAQEKHLDPAQLAQRVGTTHALEGSLREAGDELRIDLRLVETPSGRTLWAQDYERKQADVLAIQREIAQAVTGALSARLGLSVTHGGKVDLAQYREYVELRTTLEAPEAVFNGVRDRPRYEAALARLRELVARNPDNASALGFLARVLAFWRDQRAQAPLPGAMEEAERDAARALELEPDNADAHAARAVVGCHRMDWNMCLGGLKRAVELDPASVRSRGDYAYRLGSIGYIAQAQSEAETAALTDPLAPSAKLILARLYDTLGRHNDAKRELDAALTLDAAMPQIGIYSAWYNAFWRGDYSEAETVAARMPAEHGYRESYLALARTRGDPKRWSEVLPLIEASEREVGHYNFLRWQQQGFDASTAFVHLETMIREGFPSYLLLLWQPEYSHMRATQEFQDFLRRTNILEYWRVHGFPLQCKPEGDGAHCD